MKRILGLVLVLAVLAGVAWLVVQRLGAAAPAGRLFGNVEIRQVDLAFNSEGTVLTMAKREGDKVARGDVVAELDPATYRSLLELSQARRDAAQAQLTKLLNGTRKEDLDQARANVANAQASLVNAQVSFDRQAALVRTNATPQQAVDDARRALDSAKAELAQTQAALEEAIAGPRQEDIDAARAQLRQSEASVTLAQTQLGHTELHAPSDGIVMTRVIEPGTVVLPTSVVYSVAITGEVWVRAFVPEPLLGRVVPGVHVRVTTDSRPDKPYDGVIGYVSPTAEFTPKAVETPELRTQLVYRIRVRIADPDDGIRQGQPVTIDLPESSGS
jgi:HlyD family secretion protein